MVRVTLLIWAVLFSTTSSAISEPRKIGVLLPLSGLASGSFKIDRLLVESEFLTILLGGSVQLIIDDTGSNCSNAV